MKDINTPLLIKIAAFIFLAYGSIQLIIGLKHLWWSLRFFFYPSNNTLSESLYFFSMTFFFKILIPAFALISGIGLLKQKKWGWYFALITTLIVFTLNLTGTINFIIASYHYRNIPMPPIPEGSVVQYISMIPTYMYTIVGLLLLLVLTHKSIRLHFKYK